MPGRHRTATKEDSTGVLKYDQEKWAGGENSDLPASAVAVDEVPLLEDIIAFPGFLEGHSGSKRFTNTALPGSGTVRSLKQHPTSKKWVLHRGVAVWVAPSTQASWTQLEFHAARGGGIIPTINGDTGTQLSNMTLVRLSRSNTEPILIRLYWNLTNSGVTRTLNLYKDSAKTQLVGRAQRDNNGWANIKQQNNSQLGGFVTITYTGDDTDAGNTLTGLSPENGNVNDVSSQLVAFNTDFLLFANQLVYVDLTGERLLELNSARNIGFGLFKLPGSGSAGTSAPYGYRYLYTFSRITDANGAADVTKNRVSGTLVFEGPANSTFNSSFNDTTIDYGEYWRANPISSSNQHTLVPTSTGAADTYPVGTIGQVHYTHLSLYRSLDIGVNGIDVNGEGNKRDVYVWVGDYDITADSIVDAKSDDELRANFTAGFGLTGRFFVNLPNMDVGQVTPNFVYAGTRGQHKVNYCQLSKKEGLGFHHPTWQFLKLDDGVQIIAKTPDLVSFICSGKTWVGSPNAYKDVNLNRTSEGGSIDPVFQLQHLIPQDETIGVTDWSSFTEISAGVFIGHCSDHTIRKWNGVEWGEDLSSKKVRKVIRKIVGRSVGAFVNNVYLLWYRDDSSAAYNNKCLRYGFGEDAGKGWSRLSRATWIYPPLEAGANVFLDSNSLQRLLVLDHTDGLFFWVETFDSFTGSGLSRLWKDKVLVDGTGGSDIASAVTLRERVGSEQHFTLRHQETHISLRPTDPATGYQAGFQVSMIGYVDGASTATETVTNIPKTGDIAFGKEHKGLRLQHRLTFNRSGWRLLKVHTQDLEDDRKALGQSWAETDEAGYQRELTAGLKHWLTRFNPRLNRARGSLYTLGGPVPVTPAFVTGPDGRDYALSINGNTSLSQSDTTSYGDFSAHFWAKAPSSMGTAYISIYDGASIRLVLYFSSNTGLEVIIPGLSVTITIPSVAATWRSIWVVRSGATLNTYVDGALVNTQACPNTALAGTIAKINDLVPAEAIPFIFDVRLKQGVVSAGAVAYYYDQVVNHQGVKVLP